MVIIPIVWWLVVGADTDIGQALAILPAPFQSAADCQIAGSVASDQLGVKFACIQQRAEDVERFAHTHYDVNLKAQ